LDQNDLKAIMDHANLTQKEFLVEKQNLVVLDNSFFMAQ